LIFEFDPLLKSGPRASVKYIHTGLRIMDDTHSADQLYGNCTNAKASYLNERHCNQRYINIRRR